MTPILTCDHEAELTCDRGTMRMILQGALADANLWTRAIGASTETKNHWTRRSNVIRGLLDQLPAPVNPRDPFEDLPGEPTPEEAAAMWKERSTQEDARAAARKSEGQAAEKPVDPELEWSTELEVAAAAGMLEPPVDDEIEDLLAL